MISREDLSVVEKDVVDTLMQFSDKMPTKGLVGVYNSVHPIIDIEGIFCNFEHCYTFEYFDDLCIVDFRAYGATGQEKIDTFSNLAQGKGGECNLQDSLVDVHVHGGTKRKAELPTRPGKGKDVMTEGCTCKPIALLPVLRAIGLWRYLIFCAVLLG